VTREVAVTDEAHNKSTLNFNNVSTTSRPPNPEPPSNQNENLFLNDDNNFVELSGIPPACSGNNITENKFDII